MSIVSASDRAPAVARMLDEHPFERSVFLMTRFPRGPHDPVAGVIELARATAAAHGLKLHLASDRQLSDDLHGNVLVLPQACKYGIALIEDRVEEGLNGNMVFEVGAMHALERRCALLRDVSIDRSALPSNLTGIIRKSVDFTVLGEVARALHGWFADDLGLGHCLACGHARAA